MKPLTSTLLQQPPQIIKLHKTYQLPGYLPGFRQTSVISELVIHQNSINPQALDKLDHALSDVLPAYIQTSAANNINDHLLIQCLIKSTCAILDNAGIPRFSKLQVLARHQTSTSSWFFLLALPSLGQDHSAIHAVLSWIIQVINLILHDLPTKTAITSLADLNMLVRRYSPQGFNTANFLRAADEANIPWQQVTRNTYQFGWGAKSRWLDSSFTDATPNISTRLARDKVASAAVLRRAGIPVPDHSLSNDADHAVMIAKELGYPVVIKPADKDGGLGVSAGLKDENAVRKAFIMARAHSPSVLVEKHFEGNDYRLQVHQGKVFWAVHRIPGGITGDGTKDITQLLRELNEDPLRGEEGGNLLKRIAMDDEALDLLTEQGLTLTSVPKAGQFVRLRRAANVAVGGVPVPVLEDAHPDNLVLAIRAARALRLDLAGIDLLIPDIRHSWLETGAVICEVNAQPQLSPNLPALLLKQLVDGNGRIPLVMILGDVLRTAWFINCYGTLKKERVNLGAVLQRSIELSGQHVASAHSTLQGVQSLLADPLTQAVLAVCNDAEMLSTGAPVDCLDVLVLAAPLHEKAKDDLAWRQWEALARMLAPLSKKVWVLRNPPDDANARKCFADMNAQPMDTQQISEGLQTILGSANL